MYNNNNVIHSNGKRCIEYTFNIIENCDAAFTPIATKTANSFVTLVQKCPYKLDAPDTCLL